MCCMAVHTVSCVYLCMSVSEIYYVCLCIYAWRHTCGHSLKMISRHLQTPLSPTPRLRRRKTRAAAKLRLLQRRAVWRYRLFLNPPPPVQTVTPRWFPPWSCISASLPPLPVTPCVQVPKRIEVHAIHTYVALYKFLPQEQNDLELQWVKAKQTAILASKCVHVLERLCAVVFFLLCAGGNMLCLYFCPSVRVFPRLLLLQDETVPTICRGRCRGALKDD